MKNAMVIIVCVLVLASSFGCLSDTIDDDSYPKTTINLSSPRISYTDHDDNSTFNAEVTINKITFSGTKIRWEDVYLNISDSTGGMLFSLIPIEAQAPLDDTVFHAIYTDHGPNTNRMDSNDTILFVSMDERFAGSRWSLMWDRKGIPEGIGSIYIPTKHVTLSFISLEERIENEATWYDVHFQLDFVFCPGTTLKWKDCQIRPYNTFGHSDYLPINPYPIEYGGSIEAWYHDTIFSNTTLDDRDMITISGLSIAYQDGWMSLSHNHEAIGSVRLPSQLE